MLDAHAPPQLGVALRSRVEQRVEVLAVALEAQDERLVVDAGADGTSTSSAARRRISASCRVVFCTEWQSPTTRVDGVPS